MAFRIRKLKPGGYTLIEMAIATTLLAIMSTTVIMANRFVNKQGVENQDRTFATEKAIQMYEELRALVNGNEQLGVGVLEDYSNFNQYDLVLTTDKHVDTGLAGANPADPLSGNFKSDGNWRYMRQIEVNVVANDTQARQVTVKVFRYPGDYAANNQTQPGVLLATVGGILRTSAMPNVPTQVMDLYILQINNIPSWWSVLPTLAGYMQADIADLESRLTGVQIRTHYITRSSYGRDYYYQPETNSFDNPSESTHQQWVYYYPGITPQQDLGTDFWYYDPQTAGDPNSLLMTGNFMVDGTSYPIQTTAFNNTEAAGYSVADQYNNAMRYPDELAAYSAVTAAAANFVLPTSEGGQGGVLQAGTTEISERMLLEGMLSQPASFANSIIIDLHGELLPLPPLRNYSDAAKDPGSQLASTSNPPAMACSISLAAGTTTYTNQNVRVVAHPELLYYPGAAANSSSVTVRYRVYAYYDSEDTGGVLPKGDPRVPAISLFFPDAAATVIGVTAIVGNGSSPWPYGYQSPPGPYGTAYNGTVPGDDPAASGPMSVNVQLVGGNQQTLITLYNTPLRASESSNPPTPNPNVVANVGNPDLIVPCAISLDNEVEAKSASATLMSFNYIVGTTGSNSLLVVQVDCQANVADTVKTCTYNGATLTKAVGVQSAGRSDLETWYMVNPPAGVSHPVSVVMTSTTKFGMIVSTSSYFGVNQTTPLGNVTSQGNQGSSSTQTLSLTTLNNNSWIINEIEARGIVTITPNGTGQNEIWEDGETEEAEGNYMTTGSAGVYTASYALGSAKSADETSVEIAPASCAITPSNTPTKTVTFPNTPTFTTTPTYTNTPIPPTATPTPTFTNGPCTIAYSSAVTFESDSATTASIPCRVTGYDNLLMAQINIQDNGAGNRTVKSCYFNNQPMTQAIAVNDNTSNHGDLESWYIAESGSVTATLAVTINGAAATLVVGAISYQGVNQNSPIGATSSVNNQNTSTTHINFLTTTVDDSWIVSAIEFNNTGGITPTGLGHDQRWFEATALNVEGDDEPTGAAGSYGVTYSTGNHSADLESVEIIPCYIGPTPTPTPTNTPLPVVPTNTFTVTNTPVFTATPTMTGTTTPSGGGTNASDRLYGSEYIPCAPDAQSGTVLNPTSYTASLASGGYTFTSRDLTFTGNGPGVPKNTARWIISVSMPITSVFPSGVTIFNQTSSTGVTIAGQHTLVTRLGAAVTTSAVTIAGKPVTIYPNLSRTYVWCGDAFMPPYTEQYQFMGDARDCPYYDVKFGGVSITGAAVTIGPNAYNWWFKDGDANDQMAKDGYAGFGAANGAAPWAGRVQVDMPRYYQLVRQALLSTTSVWANTNGWGWYYYGLGGEIGSDQSPRSTGVQMKPDIFMTSYTAGAPVSGYNDILGDGTWANGLWVASENKGSNSVTWYQRSWLGELYPDASYLSSWVSYGNLPSVANTTIPAASMPETFYMEGMNKVQTSGPSGSSDDGFESTVYLPNPQGTGANSFYNGNNTTTGKTFEHVSGGANGTELTLAVTTYNIYPFPLADVVNVNREWDLNGSNPPEWSDAPYNQTGMRTLIDIPTVQNANTGGVTSRIFYDYNQNGGLPTTPPYGSGVIRMNLLNGAVTSQVGYVVETGTAPSGSVGAQTLAETALVFAMRTFLDGGQMAATGTVGHIVQLPLVKIFLAQSPPEYSESQTIAFTVGSPVTATSAGGGAVSVGMPVTDIWWGYNPNGLASYYTEEYPQASLGSAGMTAQTGNYQEAVSVIYNLKYSSNGGKTWSYVQDDAAAVTGVCDCDISNPSPAGHAVTNVAPLTYNWPVSTGTRILTQGVYELMVEAYRQNYGEHYSYDIQDLEVSW